ncbi:hypothetical protein [Hymenobacter norwichensis]|uniref:hypothetical protein n=1 Tax=Hymenobacter norwichensis TaxID=223903 RepID=UPI001FE02B5B|nr:hypothetical protein [Hymenobacter norwichensis]
MPPRLMLALLPPLLTMAALFFTRAGRTYLDNLRLEILTCLHIVRVAVEMVLLGLYVYQAVPHLMTFEGRNWDMLSGLSAPLVYYAVFQRKWLGTSGLLWWNVACLGLLLNIVVLAVLAVPSLVQQWGFTQPNVAVLHFPYIWLPSCVVPLVLLSHLAAIRQLTKRPQPELVVPTK